MLYFAVLIPLSQTDTSSLQPGNTILLPILPTLLPDGNVEMRIAGMNVAFPTNMHEFGTAMEQMNVQSNMASSATVTAAASPTIIAVAGSLIDQMKQNCGPALPPQAVVINAMNFAASCQPAISNTVAAHPKTVFYLEGSAGAVTSETGTVFAVPTVAAGAVATSAVAPESSPTKLANIGRGQPILTKCVRVPQTSGSRDGPVCRADVAPKGNCESMVYQCEFCPYTNHKRYLLLRHMKSHSEERPFKCTVCERCFKTNSSLQNHINTHTGTRPHQCKGCELAFTTSGELIRHIRYKHTLEKPHKCTECSYASVELSKLKRHIRSHTGERPYHCPHCSYASPDTYKLKRHLRVHTGEKPYQCEVCNQRFTQSNSLKAHKLIHSGSRPVFQCKFCPSSCGRKTDLRIHVQKLHTASAPIKCKKCDRTFTDRYTFKLHCKEHDGERCYQCHLCPYSAMAQRHLEAHTLLHHSDKPYKCVDCNLSFKQVSLLKRHVESTHAAANQLNDNLASPSTSGVSVASASSSSSFSSTSPNSSANLLHVSVEANVGSHHQQVESVHDLQAASAAAQSLVMNRNVDDHLVTCVVKPEHLDEDIDELYDMDDKGQSAAIRFAESFGASSSSSSLLHSEKIEQEIKNEMGEIVLVGMNQIGSLGGGRIDTLHDSITELKCAAQATSSTTGGVASALLQQGMAQFSDYDPKNGKQQHDGNGKPIVGWSGSC
ncbi:zinc finger, C2H2 type [Trichinella nativa]|uniref:Zinc finger, C2H2 type n=1 Tax=Trichinella nativa TaxID=6335 RepID=A0A1Y3EV01_9BILA|nr:zinc finger, C2H2 type [Trichinella nativa]